MKIFIRIIRVILGLVLLAAFAYGLYTFAQAAPKSGDIMSQLEDESSVSPLPVAQNLPVTSAAPVSVDALPETTPPPVEQAPEPTPLHHLQGEMVRSPPCWAERLFSST